MNSIQLGIIASIAFLILITIGYYWYQEAKFKRMVENNFNYQSFDLNNADNSIILDQSIDNTNLILQKDIEHQKDDTDLVNNNDGTLKLDLGLFEDIEDDNGLPKDSLEAFFSKLDSTPFAFADEIDPGLDYIIDIGFEEAKKLKFIPEISQLTQHHFKIYVLDKNNEWHKYSKTAKYTIQALKIAIELINKDGVINHIQITNIYNELHKFVLQNDAHIRQSDYNSALSTIHNQIKHVPTIKLDLELFLILKEKTHFTNLNSFFLHNGFTLQDGRFNFIENNQILFSIHDENYHGLQQDLNYELLLISSHLHLTTTPNLVIDRIFDIAERFMQQFESRLLTTNKRVFTSHDYLHLNKHVANYVINAKKHNIELGGRLLYRIH